MLLLIKTKTKPEKPVNQTGRVMCSTRLVRQRTMGKIDLAAHVRGYSQAYISVSQYNTSLTVQCISLRYSYERHGSFRNRTGAFQHGGAANPAMGDLRPKASARIILDPARALCPPVHAGFDVFPCRTAAAHQCRRYPGNPALDTGRSAAGASTETDAHRMSIGNR